MNPNWPRWIFASCSDWFKTKIQATTSPIPLMIAGEDRNTTGLTDWSEFRLDGPIGRQQTLTDWTLYIHINVLISSIKDEKDAHKVFRDCGIVLTGFTTNIPVFRYGDDDGYEGCLILRSDLGEALSVNHFGEVLADNQRIMQSTVEAYYKGIFTF